MLFVRCIDTQNINVMNLLDFYRQYPDEASCEAALRRFREHHGLFCSQCSGLRLSWNPSHKSWTCMDCRHEMQLRSGTVMQGSRLPVCDWFAAMFLQTATKRAISAKEIQRQLGRKRYQPVWEMTHKLRDVMGKGDSLYALHGDMEVDEASSPPKRQRPRKAARSSAGVEASARPPSLSGSKAACRKPFPARSTARPRQSDI